MSDKYNLKSDAITSRIDDAIRLCDQRQKPVCIGFLNECQIFNAKLYLDYIKGINCIFFGGYSGATRTFLGIFPYDMPISDSIFPIKVIQFKYRRIDKLTHRDFLGAIMALGVTRDSIGDILVNDGEALVFAEQKIAEYIVGQISKIGSVGVNVRILDNLNQVNFDFTQNLEDKIYIVSSLRLDTITAAITGLSRDKTAQLILSGAVTLNYNINKNVSCNLKTGDLLSIRKTGKFIIGNILGETKKNRIKIIISVYK